MGCGLPLGVQPAGGRNVGQQSSGNPEALRLIREASAVVRARSILPPGGPPVEIGEQPAFGIALPPVPLLSPRAVHNGRILRFPIPPLHGPVNALHRLFPAGCAGPEVLGTTHNFLHDLQADFDGPPEVADQFGEAFRSHSHLPFPPSSNAFLTSICQRLRSLWLLRRDAASLACLRAPGRTAWARRRPGRHTVLLRLRTARLDLLRDRLVRPDRHCHNVSSILAEAGGGR